MELSSIPDEKTDYEYPDPETINLPAGRAPYYLCRPSQTPTTDTTSAHGSSSTALDKDSVELHRSATKMNYPSDGVPPALLPHVHLVSAQRYPSVAHLNIETVVDYLLQAPTTIRENAGVSWMFLDAPADNSVMLVWQPPSMGKQYASDGYIWADAETAYTLEPRGYSVEMLMHRSGYRPRHEQTLLHSRRRYHFTAGSTRPECDSSLWLVHYTAADPRDRLPAAQFSMSNQATSWNQREYLKQRGQLVRKEFMFPDRNNWPTINVPTGNMPLQGSASIGYQGNVISHMNRSQQPSYMQQQQPSGSPDNLPTHKRRRIDEMVPGLRPSAPIASTAMAPEAVVDDDEDNSKGDLMDFLTPREISTMRYRQHHEWIEEVFSSPYSAGRIVPAELGLGRKGELESLTRDFFNASTSSTPNVPSNTHPPRVGKLVSGKAEEFSKKVDEFVAAQDDEIEMAKRDHTKEMAKIKRGRVITDAEKSLRSAPWALDERVDEDWTFNGSARSTAGNHATAEDPRETVGDIVGRVEGLVGKKVVVAQDIQCVQKGGLEEKTGNRAENRHDYDLTRPSAKIDAELVQSKASTISPQPPTGDGTSPLAGAPQSSLDSGTLPSHGSEVPQKSEALTREDMAMADAPEASQPKVSDAEDWVMVGQEKEPEVPLDQPSLDVDRFVTLPPADSEKAPAGDTLDAGRETLPSLSPNAGMTQPPNIGHDSFSEAVPFEHLNSAGDALSGYGQENLTLGLDDHGELGLDDSAFGDAFHGSHVSPEDQQHMPGP